VRDVATGRNRGHRQSYEIYNNTFYAASYPGPSPATAVRLASSVSEARVANNLCHYPGAPSRTACVEDRGTNNIVGNNSQSVAANPQFVAHLPHEAADFKPTANFGGAERVPIWSDFFGSSWPPMWSLGAIHP
jgi:hypothetical protein